MQPRHTLPGLVFSLSSLLVLALSGQFPVHAFHILLPILAFAVFAGYVALDVRKHGFPAFTWRLAA